jgi:hypothetical protein
VKPVVGGTGQTNNTHPTMVKLNNVKQNVDSAESNTIDKVSGLPGTNGTSDPVTNGQSRSNGDVANNNVPDKLSLPKRLPPIGGKIMSSVRKLELSTKPGVAIAVPSKDRNGNDLSKPGVLLGIDTNDRSTEPADNAEGQDSTETEMVKPVNQNGDVVRPKTQKPALHPKPSMKQRESQRSKLPVATSPGRNVTSRVSRSASSPSPSLPPPQRRTLPRSDSFPVAADSGESQRNQGDSPVGAARMVAQPQQPFIAGQQLPQQIVPHNAPAVVVQQPQPQQHPQQARPLFSVLL